jgi:hypothetical protein
MISKPMVCLAKTVHLSCIKTNTISKGIETRFYMTHVTKEFDRVRPKRFLRLRYVWCKLWIYLAPILTPSPNRPKRDSTWPTSPRSSIGCVQNYFWAYGTFSAKRCTYLESRLALYPNGPKQASIWASSPRSIIRCVQNDLWGYGKFGANGAPILHWN